MVGILGKQVCYFNESLLHYNFALNLFLFFYRKFIRGHTNNNVDSMLAQASHANDETMHLIRFTYSILSCEIENWFFSCWPHHLRFIRENKENGLEKQCEMKFDYASNCRFFMCFVKLKTTWWSVSHELSIR